MTKKKRFGISEALTRGLSETIHVVENNTGMFRNVVLPLSRIELDPENPRKLAIDLVDIRAGIRTDDPLFARKQEELERLKELAHTIKTSGVINPVTVYKLGEVYRVVAGERRCMAAILAGKQEIDARVFSERPRGFDLKLVQWIENTAREDLSLDERLGNVRDIIREYQQQNGEVEVTATLLKTITGLSLSQTSYYLTVMQAPDDVRKAIEQGEIRNLDKAALIAGVTSKDMRHHVIDACKQGASLKALRNIITQQKSVQKAAAPIAVASRGRTTQQVNMGSTRRVEVVKRIVECVLSTGNFDKYKSVFSRVDWKDLRQTSKAFRKLVEIMESETAV